MGIATFQAASTWTCPAGVTSVAVECVGPGGNGGGCQNSTAQYSGQSGGSGAYANNPAVAVTPGNVYNIANLTPGHRATFPGDAVNVIADYGVNGTQGGVPATAGQGGLVANCTGVVKIAGTTGTQAVGGVSDVLCGSGGPGAPYVDFNGNQVNGTAGAAGTTTTPGASGTGVGPGGIGGGLGLAGGAGYAPGGGGGGAGSSASTNTPAGGAGGNGQVKIFWGADIPVSLGGVAINPCALIQDRTASATDGDVTIIGSNFSVLPDQTLVNYRITDPMTTQYEDGVGTYNALLNTISRDEVGKAEDIDSSGYDQDYDDQEDLNSNTKNIKGYQFVGVPINDPTPLPGSIRFFNVASQMSIPALTPTETIPAIQIPVQQAYDALLHSQKLGVLEFNVSGRNGPRYNPNSGLFLPIIGIALIKYTEFMASCEPQGGDALLAHDQPPLDSERRMQGRLTLSGMMSDNDADHIGQGSKIVLAPILGPTGSSSLRSISLWTNYTDTSMWSNFPLAGGNGKLSSVALNAASPIPFAVLSANMTDNTSIHANTPADIFACIPAANIGGSQLQSQAKPILFYLNWFNRICRNSADGSNGVDGNYPDSNTLPGGTVGHRLVMADDVMCLDPRNIINVSDSRFRDPRNYLYLGTVCGLQDGVAVNYPGQRLLWNQFNSISYTDDINVAGENTACWMIPRHYAAGDFGRMNFSNSYPQNAWRFYWLNAGTYARMPGVTARTDTYGPTAMRIVNRLRNLLTDAYGGANPVHNEGSGVTSYRIGDRLDYTAYDLSPEYGISVIQVEMGLKAGTPSISGTCINYGYFGSNAPILIDKNGIVPPGGTPINPISSSGSNAGRSYLGVRGEA